VNSRHRATAEQAVTMPAEERSLEEDSRGPLVARILDHEAAKLVRLDCEFLCRAGLADLDHHRQ